MSLAFVQTWALISYCLPVQGRMAVASISVYELIMWLEATMFIKVCGLHSLTKRISVSYGKTMNVCCKQLTVATSERRIHTSREILRRS